MTAVTDLTGAVRSAEPLETLLTRVAGQACALIGFDCAAVMLADAGGDRLLVRGAHGLSEAYVARLNTDHPLRVQVPAPGIDAPAAHAMRDGVTVAVADIRALRDFDRLRLLADVEGYRALLAAPLLATGRPIGVLVAYSTAAREFTAAEVELAELLAGHAAVAVETAALRESEQHLIGELRAANDALRAHQDVLDRTEELHRRLMELGLDDVGLPGLVTWLAQILRCSVTVEDLAGTALAHAPGAGYVAPPAGRPAGDRGGSGRGRDGLVELRPAGDAAQVWETAVVLGGQVAGRLWLTGVTTAPDAVERRTVERFALVVAFEMLKLRHGVEIEARLSQDLLTDLLGDGGTEVRPGLLARAAALGCDLSAPHAVVVLDIGPDGEPGSRRRIADIAEHAMARAGDGDGRPLVGSRDGALLVLLPDSPDVGDRVRRIVTGLRDAADPHPVSAVIGASATSPAELATAARVARCALDLVRESGPARVLDIADLGVHALLLESGAAPGLRAFSGRLIGPLDVHDRRHGSSLVVTLRTWLRAECSTSATARALVVHRNTVTYRLARVEELLGRRLRTPDSLLQLQLAVLVRDIEESGSVERTT